MNKQTKSEGRKDAPSFQDLILRLERFWADQGCIILQPYDMEVGAAMAAGTKARSVSSPSRTRRLPL